jgi:FMN phosphatase YigB (HAD superfamily)
MKNIKAIIFDAYGTLFDVNSAAQNVKIKLEINGKLLQIIGELIN